ncbi:ferritin family protein [Burkholderiaceae bacterium FT117]|uniref:ferritin-like domain-containing protein n=1 Tax=Zeimonas sediminis TaxID=2944268 RepID=UPI002342E154|nr:ferritin family protein [Zeimonas sediminis]MCM5569028.1 ferritin family protein [Zeimonas sediminis]
MKPASTLAPASLDALMRQAYTMEVEAGQRYADLADAMQTHNNREVADLFRRMAVIESRHASQILAQMGWAEPPAPQPIDWEGFEAPETVAVDDVHYLMRPWHALALALAGEQRAVRFFAAIAETAGDPAVRAAALELRDEELGHVTLIEEWMQKVPRPEQDWDDDPDPPRYTD